MRVIIGGVLVLIASAAVAQPVVNPTRIEFDHDADSFAATVSYEGGYFTDATAAVPVQTVTIPKPGTCDPCTGPLPARPTQLGTWYVSVRAIGRDPQNNPVPSDWSARVPFVRALSAPVIRGLLP